MLDARTDDHGFGLVEVIIAMLLLAVIAMAILPALWQGIRYSTEQSSVATATRFMNSLVEEAREGGGCDSMPSLLARTAVNGRGDTLRVSGSCDEDVDRDVDVLTVIITGEAGVLATTTALIYP